MKVSVIQLLTQSYTDVLPWYLELLPGVFIALFVLSSLCKNICFYMTMYDGLEDNGFGMFMLGVITLLYILVFIGAIFYKFPILSTT